MSVLGKLKSQLSQKPASPRQSGDCGSDVAADATKPSAMNHCRPPLQEALPAATELPPDMPDYIPRERIETEDGPIQLARDIPFPAKVWELDWPRGGLNWTKQYPSYLRFQDGLWERTGNSRQVSYRIVQLRPKPLWSDGRLYGRNDPDPPDGWRDGLPNACPCCYGCGRRLFYRTPDHREYCALCFPIRPARLMAGNFAGESAETGVDDAYCLENVEFFLKPGVGLDW